MGATYSDSQLQALWSAAALAAGRPDLVAQAPLMSMIAQLESNGGDPNVYNGTTSEGNGTVVNGVFIYGSAGLWQINYSNWQHVPGGPAWFSTTVPFGSDEDGTGPWANPVANANAAVQVYISQGPTAWSTYTAALKQLANQGSTPPGASGPNTPPTNGGTVNNPWYDPGGWIEGVEGIAGGIVNGIGLGLQELFGGAVSPFLRLPQSLINVGWNFAAFNIGMLLVLIGGLLLVAAAFEGIAHDVVDKVTGEGKKQVTAVAASGAKGVMQKIGNSAKSAVQDAGDAATDAVEVIA